MYYTENDDLSELFVGHKIVNADLNSGQLTLDDGTILELQGNEGGCSCGAGDYDLTHLATVDNIITSVKVVDNSSSDYNYNSEGGDYQIFVIADNKQINVAQFDGDDGSGYYGTGFSITVKR